MRIGQIPWAVFFPHRPQLDQPFDDRRRHTCLLCHLLKGKRQPTIVAQHLQYTGSRVGHPVGFAIPQPVNLAHRWRIPQPRRAGRQTQHGGHWRQSVIGHFAQKHTHLFAHGCNLQHPDHRSGLSKVKAPLPRAPDHTQHLARSQRNLDKRPQKTPALGRFVIQRPVQWLRRQNRHQLTLVEIFLSAQSTRILGRGFSMGLFEVKASATKANPSKDCQMKFFVDTAEIDAIAELNDLGMVDGVTTNPSLILKSGRDILEVTKEICDLVDGPVSAEVVATEADDMIAEGRKLAKIAPNIAVKVPLTWAGLKTCKALTDEGQMVNVTLCFSANQALLAAKAGATFISPFIGRLDDINVDGMDLIADIRQIYDNFGFETEILAASIRTVNHVTDSARIGADVITAPPAVIKKLADHPLTDKGLETFLADWAKTGQKIL